MRALVHHREAASAALAIQSTIGDFAPDCFAEFTPDRDPGLAIDGGLCCSNLLNRSLPPVPAGTPLDPIAFVRRHAGSRFGRGHHRL